MTEVKLLQSLWLLARTIGGSLVELLPGTLYASPLLLLGVEQSQEESVYALVSLCKSSFGMFWLIDDTVTLGGGFAFLTFGIIYLLEAVYYR